MPGENPNPQDSSSRPVEGGAPPPGEAPVVDVASLMGVPAAQEAPSRPVPTEGMAPSVAAPGQAAMPIGRDPPEGIQSGASLELPDFARGTPATVDEQGIELLSDVELNVKIELGRAEMLIEDVLKLGPGSVVELDKLAGDPVDVLVNDRLVARGEVLVLNENFCVRISEIVEGRPDVEAA